MPTTHVVRTLARLLFGARRAERQPRAAALPIAKQIAGETPVPLLPVMKIGVISDTHNFFDPKIPQLFEGVDHILHAGDVGAAFITFQLEQIAPVTAVLGNTDSFLSLKETELAEFGERKFLVHHIVNPHALADPIKTRIAREKPDVVVFGHTHKRFDEVVRGVRYFNPGYAGKSRLGMERSLAILHCNESEIRSEFVPLA